jgi:hypothetical protein
MNQLVQYRIVYDGGAEQVVTLKPIDRLKFEEKYVPLGVLADPAVPNKQEWLYALAHFAYVREGGHPHDGPARPELRKWLELVADVEEVDQGTADPLGLGANTPD